ncbi:hypothetical protein N7499_000384 [Penicillium canescens]|uniref:Life-span regulatory factor-domain-containing protein n=1 Tax=Penicillium canescens TaxID=5083 RepID=A0AAD6IHA1_PENCN|nr:uncharacterized protein N7446_011418 [Penicillium canescens]KAJ6004316.1 hypothetical protein N7522_005961 [Penicillium canescens]KAJ6029238.1 hypothetical protein N7444_012225 [Penicillium canescens]KAJ6047669.1 hypothetical protein N7460_003816 [Penicillium canescens]KAJ6048735.1 hypothetical protein N7446_011418 [Penicillium canescens]KAJ6100754.1 hypothetical protein N7499_000384 [Penicillium canescens]
MTQTPVHRRSPSSPHASKPRSRPVLHRRGTSGANVSITKLGSGRGTSKPTDDEDMASFLNFCAMCERQITVPNNTLLYCSESCRRKDSCKPLSASLPSMSMSTSSKMTTTPPTSPPLSPRTIVPQMTPTRIPSIRIPTTSHTAKSDLDPTEWKPVLLRSSSSLASSEAWSYLSQFHGESASASATGTGIANRPANNRSAASLPALVGGAPIVDGHSHVPSLTDTPSTVSSSYSSTASDSLGSMYMYESQRPLPPRHNPYFAGTSVSKGVELVVPRIASADFDADAGDVDADAGSIFPASSAVWGEGQVQGAFEKLSAPISMKRGVV